MVSSSRTMPPPIPRPAGKASSKGAGTGSGAFLKLSVPKARIGGQLGQMVPYS